MNFWKIKSHIRLLPEKGELITNQHMVKGKLTKKKNQMSAIHRVLWFEEDEDVAKVIFAEPIRRYCINQLIIYAQTDYWVIYVWIPSILNKIFTDLCKHKGPSIAHSKSIPLHNF